MKWRHKVTGNNHIYAHYKEFYILKKFPFHYNLGHRRIPFVCQRIPLTLQHFHIVHCSFLQCVVMVVVNYQVRKHKTTIFLAWRHPCLVPAPVILTPPENLKNLTGSSIAMSCEARGFPIPTIEWMWTRVDGKTVFLPSEYPDVSRYLAIFRVILRLLRPNCYVGT